MACKMNLWSLTLLPGEKYPMYIRRDFQITNVALGEELRSTDGRSVVKVTHQPVPPFGDDSDSEFDSDIDIDDDEELDEDEFELDEEEGFKLTPKKGKAAANGDAEDDEEDEDEDEDEDDDDEELDDEDSEDDEDFDDDEEIEETNVICSLTAGKIEQASVDLTFVSGDAVMFEVTGENAVHLLGNYIYQPGFEDSDDESDYDSHDDYSDLYDDDEELEEDEDIPVGKITEIAETVVPKKATKAESAKPAVAATENKKRKADAIESPAPKAAATEATEELSKAQKKKLAKKAKRESTGAESVTAAPAQEKKAEVKKEQKQQKRTLPSGLIIEDVKVGDGPAAKGGKRLGMRYIGKLENGKQFDANTSGKPFSFVLGRGEVIKGWDEGLAGMAVGGERRLTIPAALAYGNQKLPGIPKGSTLKFDVKLVSIN